MNIFLSYALTDREWVNELVGLLRAEGMVVSDFGSSFHPGDDIAEALRQTISAADLLVAIITNRSSENPNVLFEMGAAIGSGKPFLPLLVSPDGGAIKIPPGLSGLRLVGTATQRQAADEIRRHAATHLATA